MCTAPGVKYSSLIHSSCLSSAFFTTCSHLGCTCLEYTLLLISLNPTSSTQRQRKQEQLNPGTQSYPKPSYHGSNWDLSGSLASPWSLESLFTFWMTFSGILSFCLDCRELAGEGTWHRSDDAWEKNGWYRERNDYLISSWHTSGAESEQIASPLVGSGPCAASMFYSGGRAGVPPSKLDLSVLPLAWIMPDFSWTCIILPTVLIFFFKNKTEWLVLRETSCDILNYMSISIFLWTCLISR